MGLDKLQNSGIEQKYQAILKEQSGAVPEVEFHKLRLVEVIKNGVKVGGENLLFSNIDGMKVLISYRKVIDEHGENHEFNLSSNREVIRLMLGLIERRFPITAMSSVLRVTEQGSQHDLPPSISMALYDKLPEFIQEVADRVGNIQHQISRGQAMGRSIPRDKWLEKLLPFIEKHDYRQIDHDHWVHYYRSSGSNHTEKSRVLE